MERKPRLWGLGFKQRIATGDLAGLTGTVDGDYELDDGKPGGTGGFTVIVS
jgi:hypothetical protein